jgi:hypothetical protein
MATRHRTSTPSIPHVAVVPVVSSVQRFNVTITSTATRPADGSAIARPRVDAIPRHGKGVKACGGERGTRARIHNADALVTSCEKHKSTVDVDAREVMRRVDKDVD